MAEQLGPFYESIRKDIFAFCRALNYNPTKQQRLVLQAVQNAQRGIGKRRIAVKSGQGPGKTKTSVVAGLWRTLQHKDSITIVTAPTMRQCRELWLSECRRTLGKAEPILRRLIEVTNTRVIVAGRLDWGVRLETAREPEAFQGRHETHLTFILDEASGITREIIEVIKGTIKNRDSLLLMIGNPNTRECSFFDCFNSQRETWETITLNAEETEKSEWFDPASNDLLAAEFGRNSDVYRVRVLGEFPLSDPDCVMSSESLDRCTRTDMLQLVHAARWTGTSHEGPARQFGIDLARYGSDESVIVRRSGLAIVEYEHYTKTDPARVVERAFRMQMEAGWKDKETWFVPDAGGLGQGVMHKFHDAKKNVVEFHNQGTSSSQSFANKVTEAYFNFARLATAGSVHIPKDNRLIQQLSTRRYFTNKDGKIVLESKDDYKDRGFESPDRADAVVLAFYDSLIAHGRVSVNAQSRQIGVRTT